MLKSKREAVCAAVAAVLAWSGAGAFGAAGTNDDCVNNGVQGSPFPAGGGSVAVTGGQVSGAGATLFVDFFLSPASTNDWIDADNDGLAGSFAQFPFVDNLSANWLPPSGVINTHWMFQYRSVGSVNGFNEFVENQTCNAIPISIPSERGIFNQFSYASGGSTTWGGPFANSSGTPVQPCEIEFAFLDVPSAWAVQVDGEGACQPGGGACSTDADCESNQKCVGGPKWNAKPTAAGYGRNPLVSSTGYLSNLQTLGRECGSCANSGDPCTAQKHCAPGTCSIAGTSCRSDLNCPAGTCSITPNACRADVDCPLGETCQNAQICANLEVCNLSGNVEALNTTLDDNDTIYDFVGAWVPVAYISNRGTGVQDVRYSEMQYLFTTGRLPNGENLIAVTRSVGSGTRNAIMNSTGIDTSWGRGDNVGNENAVNATFNNGPNTQPTNGEGSGNVELAVQSRRLALGYTGLGGASRAVQDVRSGLYEILNLCKDVDSDGNPLCDCTPQACAAGPRECSGGGSGDACNGDNDCPPGQTCQEIHDARPNNGYVRPKLDTVLDNCDACCGYTIGGNGSFVTRGDPRASFSGNPPLNNLAVRDYLLNIEDATLDFSGAVNANLCLNTGNCSVTVATTCRVGFDGDCPGGEVCVAKTCTGNAQCTLKTCSVTTAVCTVDGDCPAVPQTCLGSNCSIDGEFCVVDGDCVNLAQTCRSDVCRSNLNSPGQFLATTFFLPPAIDCQQSLVDGMDFSTATTNLNQSLQNYIRNTSNLGAGGDTPDFGAINPATGGRLPTRNSLSGSGMNYSDGSTTGSFVYWNGASFVTNLSGSVQLSVRNKLQGDFNEDGKRDINDADEMVKAYYVPRNWQQTDPQAQGIGSGSALGNMVADNAIPEVIGDHNGDGSLTKEDLRYFADGLAVIAVCTGGTNSNNACTSDGDCPGSRCGRVDRKQGAISIDTAIASWGRCADDLTVPCRANVECTNRGLAGPCDLSTDYYPWADPAQQLFVLGVAAGQDPKFNLPKDVNDGLAPMLVTGAAYEAGDFRADVAGSNPIAGAHPIGWDGFVDEQDIDYCCRSVRAGSWSNINQAVYMDLSCDMTGDLEVNASDIQEIVEAVLETSYGDVNLDGVVDGADASIIQASIAGNPCNNDGSCGWADGDSNCDGYVDAVDAVSLPLQAEPSGQDKVRFVSVVVPTATAGSDTALRVELSSLHHPTTAPPGTPDFSGFEGEFRYVNSFGGSTLCVDSTTFVTNYRCGQLGCQPEYRDWATDLSSVTNPSSPAGLIHITGDTVVPSSTLNVSQIGATCGAAPSANTCSLSSTPIAVTTSRWGDVGGGGGGPSDGAANVIDIGLVVDNVKGLVTAIPERRAWMKNPPNSSFNPVNVIDIGLTVDSVKGLPYPYAIAACP